MLIPMIIIFICNALIIVKTMNDDRQRKSLRFVSTKKSPMPPRKKNKNNSIVITSSYNSSDATLANNKSSLAKVIYTIINIDIFTLYRQIFLTTTTARAQSQDLLFECCVSSRSWPPLRVESP